MEVHEQKERVHKEYIIPLKELKEKLDIKEEIENLFFTQNKDLGIQTVWIDMTKREESQ